MTTGSTSLCRRFYAGAATLGPTTGRSSSDAISSADKSLTSEPVKKLLAALLLLVLLAAACGSDDQSAEGDDTAADDDAALVDSTEATSGVDSLELEPAVVLPVVELPADEIAVTLNGTEVTAGELTEFLEAWWELESVDPSVARNDPFRIEQFIQFELFVQDHIATNGELSDEQMAETAASLVGAFPSGEAGDILLDRITVWQAALDAVARDYFDGNKDQFICSQHILSGVPEGTDPADEAAFEAALPTAESAKERFEAGEDFAELAMELSTGPTGPTGGELGCVGPGAFVPAFETAAVEGTYGEAIGPVRTQFGYHVILTREPTYDEVRDALQQVVGPELDATINAAVTSGDVELNEAYGTWDATTGTLTPKS